MLQSELAVAQQALEDQRTCARRVFESQTDGFKRAAVQYESAAREIRDVEVAEAQSRAQRQFKRFEDGAERSMEFHRAQVQGHAKASSAISCSEDAIRGSRAADAFRV